MRYDYPLHYETYGPFLARVVSINDPDNRCRIKCHEPKRAGAEIDCAEPGNFDAKSQRLPKRGDTVWITYTGGDVSLPVWTFGPYREGDSPEEWELFPPTDDGFTINVNRTDGGNENGSSDLKGSRKIWMASGKNKLELYNDANKRTVVDGVVAVMGALLDVAQDFLIKCRSFFIEAEGRARISTGPLDVIASGDASYTAFGDTAITSLSNVNISTGDGVSISCGTLPTGAFTVKVGPPLVPITKIEAGLTSITINFPLSPFGSIEVKPEGVALGKGTYSIACAEDSYVIGILGVEKVQNITNQGFFTAGIL